MKTLLIILLALFSTNLVAQTNTIVDTDGDGLIEINDLDALNAIRFQLDGTSYKATAETTTGTTRGCPNDRCVGYELTGNLDFYDEDSYSSTANRITWTTGSGWQPIGNFSNAFTGQFEGNGFTISNLTINRSGTSEIGLFGYMESGAEITNVGLLNVDIIGDNFVGGLVGENEGTITNSYVAGSVSGGGNVGGLVGRNFRTITDSYATGSVTGSGDEVGGLVGSNNNTIANSYTIVSVTGFGSEVGGLVGSNNDTITSSYAVGSVSGDNNSIGDVFRGDVVGGLVGSNNGTITNSYATGSVSRLSGRSLSYIGGLVGENEGAIANSYATGSALGDDNVGGLVGENSRGTVTNSYATGSVRGSFRIGGLVGQNNEGIVTNSYATGSVLGDDNVGGLVGENSRGTVTNSYWDINTSGITTSSGGTGETTIALQSPITPAIVSYGPYYSWSTDDWDFGTNSQYPILRYADNPNTDSSECHGSGDTTEGLPICGSLLSSTLRYGLSELQFAKGNLSPDFDATAASYGGMMVNSTSTIQFRPIAINPDAKVYITAHEETKGTAIGSGDESSMISLKTDEITTIIIEVENSGETTQTVIYTLYLNYYEFNGDVDRDDDGLIEIDNLEGLNAISYQLDGTGHRESETAPKIVIGCPTNRLHRL